MIANRHDALRRTVAAVLWRLLQMTLLAFALGMDCPVVGWSQRNERSFLMNHTDGWMSGWMGGGMWIWAVVGILVVVLLVVVILKLSKK
jgi:hypothetical protein